MKRSTRQTHFNLFHVDYFKTNPKFEAVAVRQSADPQNENWPKTYKFIKSLCRPVLASVITP